jgi:hypothetical protein
MAWNLRIRDTQVGLLTATNTMYRHQYHVGCLAHSTFNGVVPPGNQKKMV